MKKLSNLQRKLEALLKGTPALTILPPRDKEWSAQEFEEVARLVQNFVNQSPEVIECDPLKDWVDEYKFFTADRKVR